MTASRPVFLSYASQDAEAARRIAGALVAGGLEVWFDKSELRGGDAWDASIRKRIKSCALFVPVISAVTNSRSEGYFRLEWKLAVERSHLMAEDQPFIVPVVIDDIAEPEARVPDAFRARQWTTLPGGETPPDFCDRLRRLLDDTSEPAPVPPRPVPSMAPISPRKPARPAWIVPAIGGVAAIAVAGLAAWQPWKAPPPLPATEAAVPAQAAVESIAVLPFANLSSDKESEFFADGVADELINTLSRIPGLRVSARSASFVFKGKEVPTKVVARQLGVHYLVEGTVRRAGGQSRITVQLTKGVDGFQLWSRTFTPEMRDLFSTQDEIATSVANSLQLRVGASALRAATGTKNSAAHEAYLRGREAYNTDREAEAIDRLEQAVKLDPSFALGHGALAEAYVASAEQDRPDRDALYAKAKASAERALQLDEGNVQAHNALAEYYFHFAWEWEASDKHMQRALAVDPNYYLALSHFGNHEFARNRIESGLAAHLRVRELNPMGGGVNIPFAYILLGRYEEAIRAARTQIAEHPNRVLARVHLGDALIRSGNLAEGLQVMEEASQRNPKDAWILASLGVAYGNAGQKDKARAVLKRMEALKGDQATGPTMKAMVLATLGDKEAALSDLERAHAQHESVLPFAGVHPGFASLRAEPRFRDILRKMKLDTYFPLAPPKR